MSSLRVLTVSALTLLVLTWVGCQKTQTQQQLPPDAGELSLRAQRLLEAAEALHHCAGEEPYDDVRREALASCAHSNQAKVDALLPQVAEHELPPGVYAVIQILNNNSASPQEKAQLCLKLPEGDFMPSLLDEEARASYCSSPR